MTNSSFGETDSGRLQNNKVGATMDERVRLNRYRGSLLGLAVGDAVGTTLEFEEPGSFEPIEDMVGGGPFELEPGQWTDDTSMALCLADSLVQRKGFDPRDQMDRYVRWYREGYLSSNGRCFDIGNTVRSALTAYETTGEPMSGSTDTYSAGNGSIMRLAPVSMAFAGDADQAAHYSGESSKTTHGAPTCVDACRYLGHIIASALAGDAKGELLTWHNYQLAGPWTAEVVQIIQGSYEEKEPPDIKGSGYVAECLEAALWAFHRSDSFREGCLLAVNLGDDADTTGAVYGQIAGAFYGEDGIPDEWTERTAYHDQILKFADELHDLAHASS
jgi:ADP-ribosyl-[dinitrogen reductase] hydrolase